MYTHAYCKLRMKAWKFAFGPCVFVAAYCILMSCCTKRAEPEPEKNVMRLSSALTVWLYDEGRAISTRRITVDDQLAGMLDRWKEDKTGWKQSYVTYAPQFLIKIEDNYTINFTGDWVVVNRDGRQMTRAVTDLDRELKQAILHAFDDE